MKKNFVIRKPKPPATLFLLLVTGASIGLAPQAFGATDVKTCSSNPSSRQLDYWLGDWHITGPGASASATSHVYLALDKCMVIESWDGGRGHKGENVFAYSPDDKSWHGLFVDNQGRVHVFVDGKVAPGAAEFSGPSRGLNGDTVLNRVRIVATGPDTVEQVWEKSSDKGATWETEFRGEYSRRKP